MMSRRYLLLALPLAALVVVGLGPALRWAPPELEECTIGAASGTATTDGRPMIWKTRDWSDEAIVADRMGGMAIVLLALLFGSPEYRD